MAIRSMRRNTVWVAAMAHDLLLSSGFLAFARHIGVLRALEKSELSIKGVCGTSSGALVGALWCAGMSADDIATELSKQRPLSLLRLHGRIWRGAISLSGLQERLDTLLPPTFEDLDRPFAVGVAGPKGHRLLSTGPLAGAVTASCAIPGVFAPVRLEGKTWWDGAAVDRIAVEPWRAMRGETSLIVHMVARSRGAASAADLSGATVIHSDRSRASFLSLRDFETQADESFAAAMETLEVPA